MLICLLVLSVIASIVDANRVSLLTPDRKYLRYIETSSGIRHVSLSLYNNTDSDIYETAWSLEIQSDGSFSLSPMLQPNVSIKAVNNGVEIGNGSKETSWILLPAGNSTFKIESKFFSGFYFGMSNTGLTLAKEDGNVLNFSIRDTKIPEPFLFLATNMDTYESNSITIPGFVSTGFSSFLFKREETYKSGLFYRISTESGRYLTSMKGLLSTSLPQDLKIQNSTWVIKTVTLDGSRAELMFELAFYPGTYIYNRSNNLLLGIIASNNSNSIFSVKNILKSVTYSISSDSTPIRLSLSDISKKGFLKHKNVTIIDAPLLMNTTIDLYDSSWTISKSNETDLVSIGSLNLPGFFLNQAIDTQVQLSDVESGNSCWRMSPGNIASEIKLELDGSNLFLGIGQNSVLLLADSYSWTLQKILSYPSSDALIVPKLDYLLGKTVKFTEFINSETMLITFDDSPEAIKPKLYRFIVNRALTGTDKYCSFQSLLFPGYWLRHDHFGLKLDAFQDTAEFKNDATWIMNFGFLNDISLLTVSIEPLAYPGMFLSLDDLTVKRPVETDTARISFYLEEVMPDMLRRKRRNIDEL